jgi:hypothetical protein
VFPQFKRETHVSETDWWNGQQPYGVARSLAIDFGYRNPFVCLWVLSDVAGRVYVMDEYVCTGATLRSNALAIKSRHAGFRAVYCDPAGNATNSQTSRSDVEVLTQEGFLVQSRGTKVQDGIDAVKTALQTAEGGVSLRIHPRCKELIRSMECYHYKNDGSEEPDKDGKNDHCTDALRYFYVGWSPNSGRAACY